MGKKVFGAVFSAVMALCIVFSSTVHAFAAPAKLTVDEEEYNLLVWEYPSDFGYVHAKFSSARSDVDLYELSLWDGDEVYESMAAALGNTGINAEDYHMIAADASLYRYDEDDGEQYEVTTSMPLTLLFELPSDFAGVEDKLKIYKLRADKRAEPVPYTLYDVEEYIYAQFVLNDWTEYAFMVSNADIEAYANAQDADDGDTAEPTKAPAATPTKAPTNTPTKTPAATPTKAPSTGSSTPSGSSSGAKDPVPQTGDPFSAGGTAASILFAGTALAGLLIYIKKK